ncbi:Subtilin transport ATP-binding protein SpaT [Vanrija pseudolonga]|uniref:Subtilin transport ATP-binding protein SpaT n=1 Tax=Vanrija pseudolonga TaxID=143232 RepID=A0AAF0YBF2_9TREE|nr:Subtilin transport ATP-binding protein SpaT [Vanrija pseudolonga]
MVGQVASRMYGTDKYSDTDLNDALEAVPMLICNVVRFLAYLWLVVSTLRATFKTQGIAGMSTVLLLSICIKLWKRQPFIQHMINSHGGRYFTHGNRSSDPYYREADDIAMMADDMQEVIFFGIGDWILARWQQVKLASINLSRQLPDKNRTDITQLDSLWSFVFQVVVSTRLVPSANVLSQLTVHNDAVGHLFDTVIELSGSLALVRNVSCKLAAFGAAIDCQGLEDRLGIDYERRREPGGMRFECRELAVTHSGYDTPSLHGINLTIEAGETMALVGFNGSGKTTLAKALLGMHTHSGTLLINGIPMQDYKPSSLHARMSCIFQDFKRYATTLRNNVGLGFVLCIDDEDVVKDAMSRGGADTILADGIKLNTKLSRMTKSSSAGRGDSTDGRGLSGGQWQRIALARTFMRAGSADFIVFDEPSSALDPAAEADLFDRIYDMAHRDGSQTTTVFVSHGFGNVRRADHIAFMAGGTITEYGTHDDLMSLKGEYHRLFTLQSRGYVGDGLGEKAGEPVGDGSKVNENAKTTAASLAPNTDAEVITKVVDSIPATTTSSSSTSVPSLLHTPTVTEDEGSLLIRVESLNADTAMPESPMLPAEVWAVGGGETAGC